MATALLPAGRKRILRELDVGQFWPAAYITALGASSVTIPNLFLNPAMSPDFLQVRNTNIIRGGAATADDFSRPAGAITISSGAIANVGPVWADTTKGTEDFEAWYYDIHPELVILDSLNRVLIKEFVTTYLAVSHLSGADGDMALTTDTNWTDIGVTSTSAKSTLVAATSWGIRSYETVNNASAGAGTRSAGVNVKLGGLVNAFTIASLSSGTAASFQLYDSTNSAVTGTAVTSSQSRPQLLTQFNVTLPATCKRTALNLTGTGAADDIYWNQAWLYNMDNPICRLPALVTESFMAPKIIQGVPRYSTASNVYDAEGMDFRPLVEGIDYWLVINQADASPYKVRFRDTSYYQWPLFVEARVPQSSLVTMSAETDAFWDLNKVIPRWKKDLLETVYNTGARRHPDWDRQYNIAKEQLSEASRSRQKDSVADAKPYYAPRMSVS